MDFKEQIAHLSDKVLALKDSIQTEEATKTAFIMPFLQMLGFDIFNPTEVIPEFTCDVGIKKKEKIDYAIQINGIPTILIECKHWKQNLDLHSGQLFRYFGVSKAKLGILTNGIEYKFYSDLEQPNRMDDFPFLALNLEKLDQSAVASVMQFQKSCFDIEKIISAAKELKNCSEIKSVIKKEFTDPSPELVKVIARQAYNGIMNAAATEHYTEVIRQSFASVINDIISERLQSVMNGSQSIAQKEESKDTASIPSADTGVQEQPDTAASENEKDRIVTTEEELEGYYIVKSILRESIEASRITYRDTISYFTVLLDDNNRKLICRLYLNSPTNKRLVFLDDQRKDVVNKISSIDDIYKFKTDVIAAMNRVLNLSSAVQTAGEMDAAEIKEE